MNRSGFIAVALLLLSLCLSVAQNAPGDWEQQLLVNRVDSMFVGKVLRQLPSSASVAVSSNAQAANLPTTSFEVEVIWNIKGELPKTVTVTQKGGWRDGVLYLEQMGQRGGPAPPGAVVAANMAPLLQPGATYLLLSNHASTNREVLAAPPNGARFINPDPTLPNAELEALAKTDARVRQLQAAQTRNLQAQARDLNPAAAPLDRWLRSHQRAQSGESLQRAANELDPLLTQFGPELASVLAERVRLEDPMVLDPESASAAILVLERLGDRSALATPKLLEILRQCQALEPPDWDRYQAVVRLLEKAAPGAQVLAGILSQINGNVEACAYSANSCAALVRLGGDGVIEQLNRFLDHSDARTRFAAALAMARGVGPSEKATAILVSYIESPQPDLEYFAPLMGETRGNPKPILAALLKLRSSFNNRYQGVAARALAKAGENALPVIEEGLSSPSAAVQTASASALFDYAAARQGEPDAWRKIQPALSIIAKHADLTAPMFPVRGGGGTPLGTIISTLGLFQEKLIELPPDVADLVRKLADPQVSPASVRGRAGNLLPFLPPPPARAF